MTQESILTIDETQLDAEWIRQPKIYYTHACLLADARTTVEEIKNQLEIQKTEVENIKAVLDMAVRSNPDKYSISGKTTEGAIRNVVMIQPECKRAMEEYNDLQQELIKAKHDADVSQALVSALDHKKEALENLVKLYGQNYFAVPKMPQEEGSREFIQETLKSRARNKTKIKREE